MKKKVILISGWADSGKNYVADMLTKELSCGADYEQLSFAGNMKKIICTTFGITESQLDKYKNSPKDFDIRVTTLGVAHNGSDKLTPFSLHRTDFRRILQSFGSEAMKAVFGDDVWTDLLHKNVIESDSDILIVTDWRFKRELWRLQDKHSDKFDIITVRIERDGLEQISDHVSEIDLNDGIDFDYTIHNDGKTKVALEAQLRYLVQMEVL